MLMMLLLLLFERYAPFHRACWGKHERHAELVAMMIDELHVDPFLPTQLPSGSKGKACREMTTNKRTLKVLDDREAKAKAAKLAALGSAEGQL